MNFRRSIRFPLFLAAGTFILSSCQTIGDQIVSSALGPETWSQISVAENLLWTLEAADPPASDADWVAWRSGLERLRREEIFDRLYLSRWTALAGAWASLRGQLDEALRYRDQWVKLQGQDDIGRWLDLCLNHPGGKDRLKTIESWSQEAEQPLKGRLGLELGSLLYQEGRYSESAAILEQSLRDWGQGPWPRWSKLLEQALILRTQEGLDPQEGRWLAQSPLVWEGLIGLSLKRSSLLKDYFTLGDTPALVLTRLYAAGHLGIQSNTPAKRLPDIGDKIDRRAVAWLLGRLIQELDNRPDLAEQLAARYRTNSPLPDVAGTDPALGFIILTVERQLLDLPDGERFQGTQGLTGAEWARILDRMLRRYPGIKPNTIQGRP